MDKKNNTRFSALIETMTARHARGWRWAYAVPLGLALYLTVPAHTALHSATPASVPITDSRSLSGDDATRYQLIFSAQEAGDYTAADREIENLRNPVLLGHALAQRYLASGYRPTERELDDWLERYADHPGAAKIGKLAAARGLVVARTRADKPLKGSGYIDHLGRSTMPGNWYEGLRLWKEEEYASALPIFTAVGNDEMLSDWERAAGHYWAYRAAQRLDESRTARRELAEAAEFPTTFYGLLARAQSGAPRLTAEAPAVSDALRHDPHTLRASLLAQIGQSNAAEEELRLLYAHVGEKDRHGIVTLAGEMNLPNLQVRLSKLPGLSAEQALYARYPTPSFMMDAQASVDPALLLAIARNESGFRTDVSSTVGALGMMQMMPATARALERRSELALASSGDAGTVAARLADPTTAVRYGAEYVKLLAREPAIDGGLIQLLAGYNAGPGTVASWKAAARNVSDPLLYIESIPYPETRNYVMQVMAQYWVYQLLLGEKPETLMAMAQDSWPKVNG
jgi:soluble lytic murein transglycosylase-like protein